jgi:hypothetical protein
MYMKSFKNNKLQIVTMVILVTIFFGGLAYNIYTGSKLKQNIVDKTKVVQVVTKPKNFDGDMKIKSESNTTLFNFDNCGINLKFNLGYQTRKKTDIATATNSLEFAQKASNDSVTSYGAISCTSLEEIGKETKESLETKIFDNTNTKLSNNEIKSRYGLIEEDSNLDLKILATKYIKFQTSLDKTCTNSDSLNSIFTTEVLDKITDNLLICKNGNNLSARFWNIDKNQFYKIEFVKEQLQTELLISF